MALTIKEKPDTIPMIEAKSIILSFTKTVKRLMDDLLIKKIYSGRFALFRLDQSVEKPRVLYKFTFYLIG